MNEWITIAQALIFLKITSRTTLYKYLKKGGIRASKPAGGKVYINKNDLINFLNNNAISMEF
jgi:excisionase family DNA binding protein